MNLYITSTSAIAFGTGTLIGSMTSIAYFVYLSRQVRALTDTRSPYLALLIGAALRIICLVTGGWLLLLTLGPIAVAGYASAFVLIRSIVIYRLPNPSIEDNQLDEQPGPSRHKNGIRTEYMKMEHHEGSGSCN